MKKRKVLIFRLCGRLAHFHNPLSNTRYLKRTYNLIPKPTLFGLLGSMLGYKGYEEGEKEPEFYKKLKHLSVFFIPDKKYPFKKMLVKYNSLNSFANNKSQNLIMQEEILVNPSYTMGIIVDTKEDKKLIDKIINKKSHYHIYLGKNEFFANIEPKKELMIIEEFNKTKSVHIDSVFSKAILDENPNTVIYDSFIKSINFSSNPQIPISEEVAFLKDLEENPEKINIKSSDNLVSIPKLGKTVYLF